MARHRNIKGMDLTDEMDDSYGSSYGTSLDSEPCVSPSTRERYTFNRSSSNHTSRLSDHFHRSRQDSVAEEDVIDVDEDARLGPSFEDDGLMFRPDGINNPTTTTTTTTASLHHAEKKIKLMEINDTKEEELYSGNVNHDKVSKLVDVFESKYQNKEELRLYKPLNEQLREYCESQDYWFDFSTAPIRFPLSTKVKGKIPTPINEIDTESLPSKVGQRLFLGPNCSNTIPDIRTPQAIAASSTSTDNNNVPMTASAMKTTTGFNPFNLIKSNSPNNSNSNSRRSSPAPSRVKENKSAINLETLLTEYQQRESNLAKPLINLIVIGHVDAGKSTLMGRLLCDLGYVSSKQMHRNETNSKKTGKSSFLYAWVLDETEEERSRGITMDVASAKFETSNRRINILDAPGHKDFIPNMITGASVADTALLVIDATKGEFEAGFELGGQTREHTMLVRSLGVSNIAVVINKLDNVDWSQERYNDICSKLKLFLKQTGFKESDVTFVPCSGLKGDNLITKPSNECGLSSWYNGPTLLQVIDNFKPPERLITKPFRLSIGDIFKGLISGLSVSGRIDSGSVNIGNKLTIMPAGESCSVKAITIDDENVNQAFAGDNVILILSGADPVNVSIGSVVCDPSSPIPVTNKFEARIVIFNSIEIPITKGLPVAIHYNSTSEQGVIKKIVCSLNKSTGEVIKKNPRLLTKNSSGLIIIETIRPICIELYSNFKDLGRFMIRLNGNTIAAGLVTNILSSSTSN